jgi:outer membrane protein assembly factor BamB
MDADEAILCLDAATGKEVWTYKYPASPVKGPASQFPGTRSTPAVGEGKICSLGVNGTVTCVDAVTGKLAWTKDKGMSKPTFYTSTSPLITDGMCIVFVNGLTAYNLADGSVKWTWGKAGQAPYGSPVLMTVDGVKTVVTPSVGALAGVNLADGKELWKVSIGPGGKDYFHHYSTPLVEDAQVVYSVTGVKKAVGKMIALKIEKTGSNFNATEMWKKDFSAAEYNTPLLKDGKLYGVSTGFVLFCMDAKTGDTIWTDKAKHPGAGSILDVGPVLLSLTSDKELIALKANTGKYEEVAKYTVAGSGQPCAVPIVAGNRIYVKDKGGSLTLYTLD